MGRDEMTTLLFARPSFIGGAARALDLGNTMTEFNESRTGAEADALAIQSDVRAVAHGFRDAARAIEQTGPRIVVRRNRVNKRRR